MHLDPSSGGLSVLDHVVVSAVDVVSHQFPCLSVLR